MRVKYWQRSSFDRLKDHWYSKLKNEGFVDLEKNVGKEPRLIQNATNVYRQAAQVVREAKMNYFNLLCQSLQEDPPKDRVENLILTRRSEGHKINDICKELKAVGESRYRFTVTCIIRKYETKWNIRKWNPSQLDPNWNYKQKKRLIK